MTIFLDTHGSPTGQRLLGTGRFVLWSDNAQARRGDTVLKWGRGMGGYPSGVRRLNPVITSDKLYQGQAIARAGIPIPKIYTNAEEWERDGYPDLVKKPREGEGGRGITLCKREGPRPGWRHENIYMRYVDKVREFRSLQIGNLSAYIMEKFPPRDRNPICWNLHQGAEWRRIYPYPSRLSGLNLKINQLATETLSSIKYDFGGVDLLMDKDENLWVLECNSRPGLGEENLPLFVTALFDYL